MNIEHDIEVDINSTLEQLESQSFNDKKETLRILLKKYSHLNSVGHSLDYYDLTSIISRAKTIMANKKMPSFLGKKVRKVPQNEEANLCMIESTISYLNKINCLKRLPKFDYREDKF